MSNASNFLEDELLGLILNQTATTFASAAYVALSTTDPLDDGSGITEPSGGSYARLNVSAGFTITGGGAGSATNTARVSFPKATGSWGTITHFAIFDASSGGNMLIHNSISGPGVTVTTSTTVTFDVGELTVTVA